MALDLSITSVLAFSATLVLLIVYSIMDLQGRKVRNLYMLTGGIVGFSVTVLSGHVAESPVLHLTAFIFVSVLSYLLFRIGSLGGADAKSLVTVSMVSPGIEFATWNSPVFEAFIGGGLGLFIMLLLGYTYSKWTKDVQGKFEEGRPVVPLIPFLLLGYIIIQVLAFL